mgnify:FL=1
MAAEDETRMTLLFVDDEFINLIGFKALFRREYKVFTALSAQEAFKIIKENKIDAIISDQRMPGMKGSEMFACLDNNEGKHEGKPLRLIVTGYAQDEEIKEAEEKGLVDLVLEKPLQAQLLLRQLERLSKNR